jgi:hypothetical protein
VTLFTLQMLWAASCAAAIVAAASAVFLVRRLRLAIRQIETLLTLMNSAAVRSIIHQHVPLWQRWSYLSGQAFRIRIDLDDQERDEQ